MSIAGKSATPEGIRHGAAAESRTVPWLMLAILTGFSALAWIDKQFLALVVSDIKVDLGMSDVQIGLLLGLAFAVSNAAITLPAGWLADRANRRSIVLTAVSTWSMMTMLCGMASSATALILARLGVGLGEGLSPPASYSLIRDGFPAHLQGRAFGIFSIGGSFGGGLAYVLGGMLLAAIASWDISSVPLLGSLRPWQLCLIIIGAVGLPLAFLGLAFADPGRRQRDCEDLVTIDVGSATRVMLVEWRALAPLAIYATLLGMLANGWAAWAPTVISRTFHLTPSQIGFTLGIILLVGAPVGLFTTGAMLDRLTKEGAVRFAAALAVVAGVSIATVVRMPSPSSFWVVQAIVVLVATSFIPIATTILARIIPSRQLGQVVAVFLLLQGALGTGLGPLAIAIVARVGFQHEPAALNLAVSWTAIVLGAVASIAVLCAKYTPAPRAVTVPLA